MRARHSPSRADCDTMGASASEILAEEKKELQRVCRQLERQRDRAMERAADEFMNARNALYRNDRPLAAQHARISAYAKQSAARLTGAVGRVYRIHDQLTVADAQAHVGASLVRAADALLAVNVELDVATFLRSSQQFAAESAKLSMKMESVDTTMDMALDADTDAAVAEDDDDGAAEPLDVATETRSMLAQLDDEMALDVESTMVAQQSPAGQRRPARRNRTRAENQ